MISSPRKLHECPPTLCLTPATPPPLATTSHLRNWQVAVTRHARRKGMLTRLWSPVFCGGDDRCGCRTGKPGLACEPKGRATFLLPKTADRFFGKPPKKILGQRYLGLRSDRLRHAIFGPRAPRKLDVLSNRYCRAPNAASAGRNRPGILSGGEFFAALSTEKLQPGSITGSLNHRRADVILAYRQAPRF